MNFSSKQSKWYLFWKTPDVFLQAQSMESKGSVKLAAACGVRIWQLLGSEWKDGFCEVHNSRGSRVPHTVQSSFAGCYLAKLCMACGQTVPNHSYRLFFNLLPCYGFSGYNSWHLMYNIKNMYSVIYCRVVRYIRVYISLYYSIDSCIVYSSFDNESIYGSAEIV